MSEQLLQKLDESLPTVVGEGSRQRVCSTRTGTPLQYAQMGPSPCRGPYPGRHKEAHSHEHRRNPYTRPPTSWITGVRHNSQPTVVGKSGVISLKKFSSLLLGCAGVGQVDINSVCFTIVMIEAKRKVNIVQINK